MTFRITAFAALLSSLAAAPAVSEVRFDEQLEAIRLAGSEAMMVHTLSTRGLPAKALMARENLLGQMGMRGAPGDVAYTNLSFSPVMTHDSNINGGYASDSFIVAGIPFTIGERYEAVSGLVLGLSGAGRARISLGTDTALDLRAGASIGYAPGHEMFKASVNTSACVNHMINYSTFTHACLDMSYRSYDLGETFQSAARVGFGQVFSSAIGTHEARVELKARHVEGGSDYDQKLASLALTSAIPGPYAINLGFQFGEKVEGVLAMRERVSLGVGFKAFERPTSITLAAQSNRGGMWLGQDLSETVTSISMAHQVSEKITVSGYVAQTNSSDSFFDDTQFGLNIGFRF